MLKGRSQASQGAVSPVFHIVAHKFGGYCVANLANLKVSRKKRIYYGCVSVFLRFRGQEK